MKEHITSELGNEVLITVGYAAARLLEVRDYLTGKCDGYEAREALQTARYAFFNEICKLSKVALDADACIELICDVVGKGSHYCAWIRGATNRWEMGYRIEETIVGLSTAQRDHELAGLVSLIYAKWLKVTE